MTLLAEFTQHIPPKGAHLVRCYGWYSSKARGLRRKATETAAANFSSPACRTRQDGRGAGGDSLPSPVLGRGAGGEGLPRRATQTWAMLIKRVYEIDPLECPRCRGRMKVIAFIEPPPATWN